MKLASFATSLRAHSLVEDLVKAGIAAPSVFQPKWTNKRLPPPRFEVHVSDADMKLAKAVLENFQKAR